MNVRHRRHAGAAIVVAILISGMAMLRAANAPAAPTRPITSLCDARGLLPPPLWRVLVIVFRLRCGPTTTVTSTITSTTSTTVTTAATTSTTLVHDPTSTTRPITTTTTVIYDSWAVRGTLYLVRCSGTPAAPVDCGPPVATPGEVVARGRIVTTDEVGNYYASVGPGTAPVQGRVNVPPNLIVDCPVTMVGIPEGPQVARFDPVCRTFPA